jgi:twitching motility protein PilT
MDIAELLAFSVKNKASDLHLSAGLPPMIRVDGDVRRINIPALDHKQVHSLVYDIMSDKQRRDYEEFLEVDFSFEIPGLARFRVNAFNQNRGAGAVFRTIPSEVLTLEDLATPPVFRELIDQPQGLILVTGPTGSGKSTTLAAMVDHVNKNEYAPHPHGRGSDRVRAHLAEVPDQPARGPPRHPRLQRGAALGAARRPRLHPGRRVARSGNHPPGADRRGNRTSGVRHPAHLQRAKTIDRIIDVFPAGEKPMVRSMLSESLRAVISQALLKKVGGGRTAALGNHGRHPGHPQPDPRGQGGADVFGDPDRPERTA